MRRLPIRLRITFAFAGVMAVLFAVLGLFLYQLVQSQLDQTLNQGLRSRAGDVSALIQRGDNELNAPGRSVLVDKGESFAQILDPTGRILDASPKLHASPLLTPAQLGRALDSRELIFERPNPFEPGEPARLLATTTHTGQGTVVVVVGAGADDRNSMLQTLAVWLLIAGPAALMLASAAGYGMATAALRPVESIRRTAEQITEEHPERRLSVGGVEDEISQLATTLNGMLARLENAVTRERAFVADASHELRTPLAILRTEIELALRGDRTAGELRSALVSAAEETDRLAALAETLLVIARADSGQLVLQQSRTSSAQLIGEVVDRFASQAMLQGRTLEAVGSDVALDVDVVRVGQALDNLVANALQHGQGLVELEAVAADEMVELHVRDSGPGLADSFVGSAFERFTRADVGRTGGGFGLGLSIVRAVARSHGGDAHVANRRGGVDFWIRLPTSRRYSPGPLSPVTGADQPDGAGRASWMTGLRASSPTVGRERD